MHVATHPSSLTPRCRLLRYHSLSMVRAALARCLAPFSLPPRPNHLIRLGTLVPKGSRWHQILLNMGDEWKKASGGKIELKIYPGGEQGDEPEMVQKLRIKKLQAVALSGAGLSGIDADVAALQIPMMLSSYEELDYVRDHISARLEKGLAQRGFIVLNWGDAGWIHFFTKQPASRPDDIRRMKLCVLQGDNATFELYKINGFQPVSLAATDILTGLQTGLDRRVSSPAAGRSQQPMVRRRQEHARYSVRATGGRDSDHKRCLGQDPGARAKRNDGVGAHRRRRPARRDPQIRSGLHSVDAAVRAQRRSCRPQSRRRMASAGRKHLAQAARRRGSTRPVR